MLVNMRIGSRLLIGFGIVVDSVRDVLRLERSQIRSAPDFNSAVDEAFIVDIERLAALSGLGAALQGLH